jgi:adenylate kinase
MEVLILFGAPGVGKGTQSELVAKNLGYLHLSTGALFRKEKASGSDFGKEIAAIMDGGKLISDEITNKLVGNFLEENKDSAEGILLDGYPRTVFQARELDKMLEEIDDANLRIINLVADEEELMKRLLLRAQHQGRADDNEETIKKRFEVYEHETFPILDYYDNTGADVSEVDGIGSVEEIQNRILKVLIGN